MRTLQWSEIFTLEELDKFPTANTFLDAKYGKKGTPTREIFDKETDEYYNQVISEPDDEEEEEVIAESEISKLGKQTELPSAPSLV